MTIQEKFAEASALEKENKRIEEKFNVLKTEMLEELKSRFPLFVQRHERRDNEWKSDEFSSEISILFRSMLTRDKIIKVPTEDGYNFNITTKHGLKYPRSHSSHDILPGPWDDLSKKFYLKDGIYHDNREVYNFSALEKDKSIKIEKLQKFLYFLEKILALWKFYKLNDKELQEVEKKELGGIEKDLTDYSDLEDFELYIKAIPILEKVYEDYSAKLKKFMEEQSALLTELQDYNKPYKVLLKLKESSTE